MTNYVITTNVINNAGSAIDLHGGDTLFLAQGAVVSGTPSGIAAADTENDIRLQIYGAVIGGPDADGGGIVLSGTGEEIVVGKSGSVSSSFGFGVEVGGASLVINNGEIDGLDGTGIGLNGAGSTVHNSGTISGYFGIQTAGSSTVFNSGAIQASGQAFAQATLGQAYVNNSGSMSGDTGVLLMGVTGATSTVDNSGTISGGSHGINMSSDHQMTVHNSGTILGNLGVSFHNYQTGTTDLLTNSGTISANSKAVDESGGAAFNVDNSGTLSGDTGLSFGGSALVTNTLHNSGSIFGPNVAVNAGYAAIDVVNSGEIVGSRGILFQAATGTNTLDNSGLIRGTGGSGTGVNSTNGGTLAVTNDGKILGYTALSFDGTADTLHNGGIIRGANVGVIENSSSALAIVNSGTISGNVAIIVGSVPGATSTITNSGTIEGGTFAVDTMGGGAIVVVNSGHIVGDIGFGDQADTYDGTSGQIVGTVSGGGGNDALTGGSVADVLSGAGGNDVLVGNGGHDVLSAGTGVDDVDGGGGADTIAMGVGFTATDTLDGGDGKDTVTLNGDYSAGVIFKAATMVNVETISLASGSSYKLTTADATVAANATLTVDGSKLAASDTLIFNGARETDGHLTITGGAGNDTITGGDLSDTLTGGAGADTFVYLDVSQSTGNHFDTLVGFDYAADKFDLDVTVTAMNATIAAGRLSMATFDANLAAAADAAHLGAGHAALFTPTQGTLQGHTFLVVDANGVVGYQAGQDYVYDVSGALHPGQLSAGDFV